MGISYNPRTITDGLVLALDAGNSKSYPGSGTAWTDLTSTTAGVLNNGPTYNSSNGGSISFDDVDDFVRFTRTDVNGGTFAYTNITCNLWINPGSSQNSGGGQANNLITVENTFEISIGNRGNGFSSLYYASVPWAWYGTESNVVKNDAWNMITFVHATTGRWLYVNGIEVFYRGDTGNLIAGSSSFPYLTIGGRFAGTGSPYGGRIANIQLYNRVFTASEIQQNYNATKGRYAKGGIDNPFSSPTEARILGYSSGDYYFQSGSMSSPQLLEFQRDYYENRGWVCVFRSPYRSTATTNKINLNIPMGGLLVQRDTLDLRAAVYWSNPITYSTVGGSGNNTADSGYSPRRVILGGSGGHGIYATNQTQCNWGSATGAIGAGWDGSTCGSFPNDLIWGTGRSDTATYDNRSGIWSHWITW